MKIDDLVELSTESVWAYTTKDELPSGMFEFPLCRTEEEALMGASRQLGLLMIEGSVSLSLSSTGFVKVFRNDTTLFRNDTNSHISGADMNGPFDELKRSTGWYLCAMLTNTIEPVRKSDVK